MGADRRSTWRAPARACRVLRRFDQVLRRGQEAHGVRAAARLGNEGGRARPVRTAVRAHPRARASGPGRSAAAAGAAAHGDRPATRCPRTGAARRSGCGSTTRGPRSERVAEVLAIDRVGGGDAAWCGRRSARPAPTCSTACWSRRPRGRFAERDDALGARLDVHTPERWLPRQQAGVRGAAGADHRATPSRAGVAAGGGDPGRGPASPAQAANCVLRHVDAPEVVIAEAALGALVWTDRPDEALTVLLAVRRRRPRAGRSVRGRAAPPGTSRRPACAELLSR